MKKNYLILCSLIFINYSITFSQTNYNVCCQLINQSVKGIDSLLDKNDDKIKLEIIIPSAYEELKPCIVNSFLNNGFNLLQDSSKVNLIYALTDITVNYHNINQINFFTDDKLVREISLAGYSFFSKSEKPNRFFYKYSDTVKFSDVESLENKALTFTQGKIPEQPVLKNLIQPVIIVGVLISTVILFFTVRSK
ncbi:MAG: hypothetical protein WHS65_06025 [Melioribacteraceae bacterium]